MGIPFEPIEAVALRGRKLWAVPGGLWAMFRGFRQARRLIDSFRPDILFVTGGYVCGPVTLAAWRAGVPTMIYLPDIEPGLMVKTMARFVRRVSVTAPPSLRFFHPGQAVVTGYPVRQDLFGRDPAQARQRMGLTAKSANGDDLPVLLVFGGSQGAHSINRAVSDGISALLSAAQVVHVAGPGDVEWVRAGRASLPDHMRAHYYVHDYLDDEMVDALLAADLTVARAGASTLGELPAAGLPGVLVPYPYAGAHQWANARYLVEGGAAVMVSDANLGTQLIPTVLDLLVDDARRAAMSQAARALAQPDAAERIARELGELAYEPYD
jgi:UDP-N-acetylglucosamine--N-acetylmuramyl-(pentapeptide) pyrophosphoryl-undecaprenol N-acetylglucosamine transferase